MTDITGNINLLKQQIPSCIKIVAVSKTKPAGDIMIAYMAGQKCFGENRVQELLAKKDSLPEDIEWHLIGHLQSNKVKQIVPFISMIESVDSFKLLSVINKESAKLNRIVNCLLQIHIAKEETKFGFNMEEIVQMVESEEYKLLDYIRICGVMGMATFTEDMNVVKKEFIYLRKCFNTLKENYYSGNTNFKEISMGMSNDFRIAVAEGSTMIRIGSLIFGERV
jgi:pyridoxal phosphate enzyme (YggS family)